MRYGYAWQRFLCRFLGHRRGNPGMMCERCGHPSMYADILRIEETIKRQAREYAATRDKLPPTPGDIDKITSTLQP